MRTVRLLVALGLAGPGAGCGDDPEPRAPEGHGLEVLTDLDEDPGVVEVELVAAPAEVEILEGHSTTVWAYRDGSRPDSMPSVPGPLLEASEGDEIIVHFTNELAVETTIHWHGVRLDALMDGTPSSQTPVAPGASFDYRFRARDAGLFWYHPHIDADEQIERGLYAPLLVNGGATPAVSADRVLVLDDVKIESDGALSDETSQLDLMMGRQGNVLLVNGRRDLELAAAPGARERWRFVNAANGRFFRLALEGATFLVIGTDGGLLAAPHETETLLVAPGERYDTLVTLDGPPGGVLALQNLHYDRGHELPDPGPRDLLMVRLGDLPADEPAPLPSSWATITPLPVSPETVTRRLVLSEVMGGADQPSFFINGERWPDVTTLHVVHGDTEIWELENEAEMDHPFHLHGMFFQVLDQDGTPEPRLAWKDTVNVRQGSTLRFAVTYDSPGMWMYHCHILEHAELGMMGHAMVSD